VTALATNIAASCSHLIAYTPSPAKTESDNLGDGRYGTREKEPLPPHNYLIRIRGPLQDAIFLPVQWAPLSRSGTLRPGRDRPASDQQL